MGWILEVGVEFEGIVSYGFVFFGGCGRDE